MKETKKQIKAQLTNDISLRFKKRIDTLETELRCVRSELRECDNQRRKAERTVLELQDKVEKYENGEINEAPKENGAYMDFSNALAQIVEVLSKLFYILFGGAGFGDM